MGWVGIRLWECGGCEGLLCEDRGGVFDWRAPWNYGFLRIMGRVGVGGVLDFRESRIRSVIFWCFRLVDFALSLHENFRVLMTRMGVWFCGLGGLIVHYFRVCGYSCF